MSTKLSQTQAPSDGGDLTREEIRMLRELLERESDKRAIKVETSGQKSLRNFRVDDGLWTAVTLQAKAEDISASQLVTRALRRYLGAN
jgi:hypothetical protein